MAIVIVLFGLILTSGSNNIVDREITRKFNFVAGDQKLKSVVTTTMQDYVWRSEISRSKYGDTKAYKLISYYFSTEAGNDIYVDGSSFSKKEVESDIKSYLRFRMSKHWPVRSGGAFYWISISDGNEEIEVKTYEPSSEFGRTSFIIPLRDGGTVRFTIRVKTSKSSLSVGAAR